MAVYIEHYLKETRDTQVFDSLNGSYLKISEIRK